MIDQSLINKCEKDLDSFGSLMKCQAIDLLEAYISLIEQNAELHKELAATKARYEDIAITCGYYGVDTK